MNRFINIIFLLITILCIEYDYVCAQDSVDTWDIRANEIDTANYYGVTVANGLIGIVSSDRPLTVQRVILNGAYDIYGQSHVSRIMEVFNPLNMFLDVNGQRINTGNISDMKQVLNMKKAIFTSSFDFKNLVNVTYSYMALRQMPYTVLLNVTIKAKKDVTIMPSSIIKAPDILQDVQNYYSKIGSIGLLSSTANSPTGKLTVAASNGFIFTGKKPEQPKVTWDTTLHVIRFQKHLKKGESYTFSVVSSVLSSAGVGHPLNEAKRLTISAILKGKDRLMKVHEQAWDSLWVSDIVIKGDSAAQQAIHLALYNLYSFVRGNTAYSIPPMGLSSLGYNGHIFWDAEMWMYPVILILHPNLARSMIEYRYNRLKAAEQNASINGYKGAMYPWESAGTGDEETPVWALTGPLEQHITADVGIAAWNYFCVIQDSTWLRNKGYAILKETADFWVSRVEEGSNGQYNIDDIVAADEWGEDVDNDAFTNAAAITNLKDATAAAEILGVTPNPEWIKIAGNIPIQKFHNGVTKEFDSYHGEQIKQADVSLLAYPLNIITDTMQIRKDLRYYEPRIGNGPAMSYLILSILYERLGDPRKAYQLFQRSYQPNEKPPFGVLAETADGTNPYFATGAGGMLQTVLNGFGGLEITPHGIVQLKTSLPNTWKSVIITGVGATGKTFKVSQ